MKRQKTKMQKTNEDEKTKLTSKTSPHLPWEILRLIFLRATVPTIFVVPDCRPQGAWNLNTKMKLQLVSVCKDWYEASISLLYEDIAIYSLKQFGALMSTLDKKSSLAAQVVSLRVATHIPVTHLPLFQRLVDTVSRNVCLNLRRFSFEESFLVMDEGNPFVRPTNIKDPPCITLTTLTHLEIHSTLSIPLYQVLMSMPLFAGRLESLIILTKEPEHCWLVPTKPSQPLQFPLLRVFQYQLEYLNLQFITAYWAFPVLDTLASFVSPGLAISTQDEEYHVVFLKAHGKRLKTLLLEWPKPASDTTSAQEAIDTLSHLRHLIIPPFLDVSASQVHWLDCFLKDDVPTERLVLFSDHDRHTRFPNLQSYRFLDSDLVRKLPLLPTLLPPTTEECRFTFPGVDIRCDTSALWGSSGLVWDKEGLDYSSVALIGK
ncbi:hypothetical protein BDP27DRAFT_1405186 [Rhodocollybia butyracea]|uniref:F-box domain-containing protein n=1 Tax=Rhodocollybia butyracea TaxID=206335 RepID=A0A9P5PG81_9AGAR|nr:hypothetical protein BDP27DRAFT_1405186 [Rhodocollybia butyracea]